MSKLLFMLTGVCGLGLAVGLWATTLRSHDHMVITPQIVELKDGVIEGSPLAVEFVLRSEAKSDATATSIASSCGCMVVTSNEKSLELPLSLAPDGEVHLRLNVATANRVGPQSFVLYIGSSSRGRELPPVQATVRANLLGTLRAEPSTVIFRNAKPGVPLTAEIELADMLPDAGEQIREVTASRPDAMRIEMKPLSGKSTMFGPSAAAHQRALLVLTYLPPAADGHSQDVISVSPADERFALLQIPVYCQLVEPVYRLAPTGLTIAIAPGDKFSRTAQLRHQAALSFSVKTQPALIELQVTEPSQHAKTIRLSGVVPDDLAPSEVVFLVDGAEVVFPIRYIKGG